MPFFDTMKKIFSFIFAFVFFTGLLPVSAFNDIEDAAVNYLINNNIVEDGDSFYPDKRINRGLFVMWALKNKGVFFEEGEGMLEPYSDIDESMEIAPYVAKAWQAGVLETADEFQPKLPLTRLEALKMIFAIEGVAVPLFVDTDKINQFDDLPEDAKSRGLIYKAIDLDVMRPETLSHFGANSYLTRLETAELLYNVNAEIDNGSNTQSVVITMGSSGKKTNEEIFDEVWSIIHDSSLYIDNVQDDELMDSAIEGMVGYLNDTYAIYYPPDETGNFLDPLEGSLEGIGVEVNKDEATGYILVVNPLKNNPAEKAGLKPGDFITQVDGQDIKDMSLDKGIALIKGPAGTEVVLTILRGEETLQVSVTREKINLQSVYVSKKDGYLILEIDSFGSNTVLEFEKAMENNYNDETKGLIIDLRGNPGGYLDTALDLLGYFLPEDQTLIYEQSINSLDKEKSKGPATYKDIPLAVLVDKYSASSSEIFAGALQDYQRAVIIGETTYGKGTVQEFSQFYNNSSFKLTVAEWFTPLKNKVNGVGITPDIVLPNTDGDAPVGTAIRELNKGKGVPKK